MTTPNGVAARWVRAALQVNPFEYHGASSPKRHFNEEAAYNKALVEQCVAENIEMIAITDHWAVNTAQGLATAASERGIAVLPGFEANSSEGIHLLIIFDCDTPFDEINAAIGQCGHEITPGCASGTTGDPFGEIVRNMTQRGALVIPAHANTSPRGMLSVFSGQPLATLVKHENLHAVAISPGHPQAADQTSVFAGRPPFERTHELAMIYSDDISHPDRLAEHGGSCWFKMSTLGLAGLRLAVRTSETRICLEDPASRPRVLLRSLSWTGGYLDGQTICFADDLTALIGGRGTGKSTAIESLRYVLDLQPIGATAIHDHGVVVEQVLGRGTIVEIVLDAVTPLASRFTIRRTVPDPPVVLDEAGHPTDLHPRDLIGSVEIFGQHELAEVAEQPSNVAQLITRFTDVPEFAGVAEVQTQLTTNRSRLARVEGEQSKLEEELAEIPRLKATVDQFEKADWPTRLAAQRRLALDEAIIGDGLARVEELDAQIGELLEGDPVAKLRVKFESLDDSPERDLLVEVKAASDALATVVESALGSIATQVEEFKAALAAVQERLEGPAEARRAEHAEVVRQLKSEGHDPDRLIASQEQLAGLQSRSSQRDGLDIRHAAALEERRQLLGELEKAETQARRHLGQAVTAANKATVGTVVAKPIASPDRAQLVAAVTRSVSNSRKALLEIVNAEDFSPKVFVREARAGNLSSKYGLSAAQIGAIDSAGEELLRALEEVVVERAVEVSLNVADPGLPAHYKALDSLSKGQRATALLLLLLGVAQSPLIIDQPEDDLDNRFIYSGIVRHLRELKGKRQIIVSTHNANVPVLGDAELIVTLEGDGNRGEVNQSRTGSLDEPAVMRTAEDILEGGHKAFDTRRHLYGF